jgi:ParB family chromosome partitioning protein
MNITQLPLDTIDADALPRDRITLDEEALATLQRSILYDGLRQPIEVFPLAGRPPCDWGLISGLRRLTVFRALAAIRPDGPFATIPVVIRTPDTIPDAMAAMVTENEVRADISPWEKATLILESVRLEYFATPDAALLALYPHISPTARSRLRAVVTVVEAMGDYLLGGPTYSLRQLLRISGALRLGFGPLIEVALREHHEKTPAVQWDLLQNILLESEQTLTEPQTPQSPGRPRRLLYPRSNLIIRRERIPGGYRLIFTGEEARGMLMDSVLDQIERLYTPV